MTTTYSAELVAPAIASLTETQLRNLVDQEGFGAWLAAKVGISSISDPDNFSPDSEAASEAAMMAGDAEYAATQILATLSEEQQESLVTQAWVETTLEIKAEVQDLMPV